MTGYYRAKRELEREEAKRYIVEREAQQRIQPVDERAQRSRVWLDKYLAPERKRPTSFNWAPRWPVTPPGEDNGKEIIEGEFAVMADADAAGEGSRREGMAGRGKEAASAGREEAPEARGEGQADFTEEDRTPF